MLGRPALAAIIVSDYLRQFMTDSAFSNIVVRENGSATAMVHTSQVSLLLKCSGEAHVYEHGNLSRRTWIFSPFGSQAKPGSQSLWHEISQSGRNADSWIRKRNWAASGIRRICGRGVWSFFLFQNLQLTEKEIFRLSFAFPRIPLKALLCMSFVRCCTSDVVQHGSPSTPALLTWSKKTKCRFIFPNSRSQDDHCKLSSKGLANYNSYLCSEEHPHEELCAGICHILNRKQKKGALPKCASLVFTQHFVVCRCTSPSTVSIAQNNQCPKLVGWKNCCVLFFGVLALK